MTIGVSIKSVFSCTVKQVFVTERYDFFENGAVRLRNFVIWKGVDVLRQSTGEEVYDCSRIAQKNPGGMAGISMV